MKDNLKFNTLHQMLLSMIKSTNGIELYQSLSSKTLKRRLCSFVGWILRTLRTRNWVFNEIGVTFTHLTCVDTDTRWRTCFYYKPDELPGGCWKYLSGIPKDLPFFCVGYSLGGLIANLHFLLLTGEMMFKGVILLGSALEAGSGPWNKSNQIISKKVSPIKTVKLNPDDLSRGKGRELIE
jgi:hypothetical protein